MFPHRKILFSSLITLLVCLFLSTCPSSASIVTVSFSGQIEQYYNTLGIYTDLDPALGTIQTFSGQFSYDTDMDDRVTLLDTLGQYSPIVFDAITVGSHTIPLESLSGARLNVWDENSTSDFNDGFNVIREGIETTDGRPNYGYYHSVAIQLQSKQNILDSDRPPENIPDLNSFDYEKKFSLSISDGFSSGPFLSLSGEITSLSRVGGATVPEPTTMLLFGTGLVGFAIRKRKA